MTRYILIAAMSDNRAIGYNGKLPWSNPEDLANFKRLTTGGAIVMGRKTFESIGRALPNRRNIVLSSQDISIDGVEVYSSIEVLCNTLNGEGIDNVCIIGGQKIYEEFLTRGLVDEIWLSRISGDYEGDVFLPHFEDSFIEEETTEFDTFRFTRYMSSKS